jgi:hypothetical protein
MGGKMNIDDYVKYYTCSRCLKKYKNINAFIDHCKSDVTNLCQAMIPELYGKYGSTLESVLVHHEDTTLYSATIDGEYRLYGWIVYKDIDMLEKEIEDKLKPIVLKWEAR